MSRTGLHALVDGWRDRADVFFSMLSLEIWGRLFFRGEGVAELDNRLAVVARSNAHGASAN